jgi:hypothetical protein
MNVYAVLSGDIVGSSSLLDRTGSPTKTIIERIGERTIANFRDAVLPEIDVYRGDSWQMVSTDPARSLRVGLFFRALIKADRQIKPADTRLSLGFGRIDYLPEHGISAGDGEAFRLSGAGLDSCKKDRRMCLVFPEDQESVITKGLDQLIKLLDFQVQGWQPRQSEAVAGALLGFTQQKIAVEWVSEAVSQQTISQHLDSAGWNVIKSTLEYFEATLTEILYV